MRAIACISSSAPVSGTERACVGEFAPRLIASKITRGAGVQTRKRSEAAWLYRDNLPGGGLGLRAGPCALHRGIRYHRAAPFEPGGNRHRRRHLWLVLRADVSVFNAGTQDRGTDCGSGLGASLACLFYFPARWLSGAQPAMGHLRHLRLCPWLSLSAENGAGPFRRSHVRGGAAEAEYIVVRISRNRSACLHPTADA